MNSANQAWKSDSTCARFSGLSEHDTAFKNCPGVTLYTPSELRITSLWSCLFLQHYRWALNSISCNMCYSCTRCIHMIRLIALSTARCHKSCHTSQMPALAGPAINTDPSTPIHMLSAHWAKVVNTSERLFYFYVNRRSIPYWVEYMTIRTCASWRFSFFNSSMRIPADLDRIWHSL